MGIKIFVGVLLAAGLLCGCSSNDPQSAPTPSASSSDSGGATLVEDESTLPPTLPTPSLSTNDVVFLSLVRAKSPRMALASDESVIGVGKAICGDYESGLSTQMIAAEMVRTGQGKTLDDDVNTAVVQAGYTIGVARSSYCPKYNGAN